MCGIVGYHHLQEAHPPDEVLLKAMLGLVRHRGPDEFGVYVGDRVGLGSARLSIVDLATGTQPIGNEDGTVWLVFNGEIYNHRELRTELEGLGHEFSTNSDTEVIVHLYEELGTHCVARLNGQFAFALWDNRPGRASRLVLARDRFGIRPLFYSYIGETLLFGSEAKALFAHPDAERRLDPIALAQVFSLWTTIGERTAFAGIHQLPPAHVMVASGGAVTLERYWELDFAPDEPDRSAGSYAAELHELLADATRLRLNADVTVGAYLSGGIDSSAVTQLATAAAGSQLETFSINFEDRDYDERAYQDSVVRALGTLHTRVECRSAAIGRVFPDVVWHAESPILRTAPAPMFLLSRLVQERGIKVVLTGEGADEILGGYNIFKEDRIRRFWARDPTSQMRPLLLRRLYPYIADLAKSPSHLTAFFGRDLTATDRPGYSHLVRWSNTGKLRHTFSADLRESLEGYDPIEEATEVLAGHPRLAGWTPLARAQYIEMTLFMSGYLLSSQGDRMLMAHSVEGRFPFLDHRVVELAARMPDRVKLRGLDEKHVLKKAMAGSLPDTVVNRPKQPFRAPTRGGLAAESEGADLWELMSERNVRRSGIFDTRATTSIAKKIRRSVGFGQRDEMALAGVLSTLVLHDRFVASSPGDASRRIRLARRVIEEPQVA